MFIFFLMQKAAYEMRISDWSSDVCSSDLNTSGNTPAAQPPSSAAATTADPIAGASGRSAQRSQSAHKAVPALNSVRHLSTPKVELSQPSPGASARAITPPRIVRNAAISATHIGRAQRRERVCQNE